MIVCSSSLAQNIQYTQNVADLSMRSDIRVDPSSLGMSLQIPLRQYPGRGGANLSATLAYSSKVWRINHVDTIEMGLLLHTREQALYAEHSAAGWTSSLDPPTIENTGGSQSFDQFGNPICLDAKCKPQPKSLWYISRLHVHMPDGSSHELRKDDIPRENSPDQTGLYYAVDGSRLRYDYDTSTLYLPDGSRYIFGQTTTQYIDRNGNTLTYNISARRWTDSLGRLIALPLPANPTSGNVTYSLPGVDGSTSSYIFRWKNLSLVRSDSEPLRYAGDRTWGIPAQPQSPSLFSSENVDLICAQGLFDPVVLSEIELPNGRKYIFTYNVWGEIDKVIYPTGGYERFVYATVAPLSTITGVYNEGNRGVIDRYVSVDATEVHWQYSATDSGSYVVSITAPDTTRNERVLHYGRGEMQFGFDEARAGQAYEERVKSGGQTVRRKLTDLTTSGPTPGGWSTATRDPRPVWTVEIMLDYGSNALARTSKFNYDPDLNLERTRQYAFITVSQTAGLNNTIGQFSDGTLMRKEETTYLVNDASITATVRDEYRARNLIALPTLSVVRNETGTTRVAETQFLYDESAYPPLTYTPYRPSGSIRLPAIAGM
jgi:hypothetical protein